MREAGSQLQIRCAYLSIEDGGNLLKVFRVDFCGKGGGGLGLAESYSKERRRVAKAESSATAGNGAARCGSSTSVKYHTMQSSGPPPPPPVSAEEAEAHGDGAAVSSPSAPLATPAHGNAAEVASDSSSAKLVAGAPPPGVSGHAQTPGHEVGAAGTQATDSAPPAATTRPVRRVRAASKAAGRSQKPASKAKGKARAKSRAKSKSKSASKAKAKGRASSKRARPAAKATARGAGKPRAKANAKSQAVEANGAGAADGGAGAGAPGAAAVNLAADGGAAEGNDDVRWPAYPEAAPGYGIVFFEPPMTRLPDSDESDSDDSSDPDDQQPKSLARVKQRLPPRGKWGPDDPFKLTDAELEKLDDNNVTCNHCKEGGDGLMGCDREGCTAAYHLKCIDVKEEDLKDGEDWYCQRCDTVLARLRRIAAEAKQRRFIREQEAIVREARKQRKIEEREAARLERERERERKREAQEAAKVKRAIDRETKAALRLEEKASKSTADGTKAPKAARLSTKFVSAEDRAAITAAKKAERELVRSHKKAIKALKEKISACKKALDSVPKPVKVDTKIDDRLLIEDERAQSGKSASNVGKGTSSDMEVAQGEGVAGDVATAASSEPAAVVEWPKPTFQPPIDESHRVDYGDVLDAWDFLRHFAGRRDVMHVDACDCGTWMLAHRAGKRKRREAATVAADVETAQQPLDALPTMVVREATPDAVLTALQGDSWKAQRFVTNLHVGLLRLFLENQESAVAKQDDDADDDEGEEEEVWRAKLSAITPLTWPEVMRRLFADAEPGSDVDHVVHLGGAAVRNAVDALGECEYAELPLAHKCTLLRALMQIAVNTPRIAEAMTKATEARVKLSIAQHKEATADLGAGRARAAELKRERKEMRDAIAKAKKAMSKQEAAVKEKLTKALEAAEDKRPDVVKDWLESGDPSMTRVPAGKRKRKDGEKGSAKGAKRAKEGTEDNKDGGAGADPAEKAGGNGSDSGSGSGSGTDSDSDNDGSGSELNGDSKGQGGNGVEEGDGGAAGAGSGSASEDASDAAAATKCLQMLHEKRESSDISELEALLEQASKLKLDESSPSGLPWRHVVRIGVCVPWFGLQPFFHLRLSALVYYVVFSR